ncbi:unnamed protein product [Protopolystoma xenopodis]|uniref:Ig-like domain-containing protein n=1 Tax=Protopolystoma xenopodis TaxID=117903 RepID=A0A3S5CIQ7_9PLAT|nr:unnamed protein product [Protopolystoma xenopodis]
MGKEPMPQLTVEELCKRVGILSVNHEIDRTQSIQHLLPRAIFHGPAHLTAEDFIWSLDGIPLARPLFTPGYVPDSFGGYVTLECPHAQRASDSHIYSVQLSTKAAKRLLKEVAEREHLDLSVALLLQAIDLLTQPIEFPPGLCTLNDDEYRNGVSHLEMPEQVLLSSRLIDEEVQRLSGLAPAVIRELPSRLAVMDGQTVRLEFEVDSETPVTNEWLFNGELIDVSIRRKDQKNFQ